MKMLNLKINQFGKLKDKEITFGEHLNIIYGKNESGKSTLLKFILAMYYGLSKNKNGKEISDLERYTPWVTSDFSGKLHYQLQNGEKYEIFREFKKKSPKIYNENLEEISKNFTIDKTNGNCFFYDQTGVEEELFISTIISMQTEVKLNEKNQSTLIQKLSNLASTGEDNVSYQKIMNQLKKRQLEEIGTQRSQDRPLNMITRRIEEIAKEKEYLSTYVDKKYDMEETKSLLEEEIREQEINVEILKELKKVKEKQELGQQKIKINENTIKEYQRKIEQLYYPKQDTQIQKKNKYFVIEMAVCFLFILSSIVSVFVIRNDIISAISIVLAIISLIYTSYQQYQVKLAYHNTKTTLNVEKVNNEIEIMQVMIQNLEKEKKELQKQQETNYQMEIEKIRNTYLGIAPIKVIDELLLKQDVAIEIEVAQNKINENKLKIQSIGLDKSSIIPKLENLAELEEEYAKLEEQMEELIKQNDAIELARNELEKAYHQMKKKVTPQFTDGLSNIMKKISDGKYTNIQFDEKDGIVVELENGSYISANALSIGTIDQLYLSLRLSAGENLSKEPLPILLDETFAYYDDERLKNILEYLNKEYRDRQILLFTCTDREKSIFDQENIPYHLIELE